MDYPINIRYYSTVLTVTQAGQRVRRTLRMPADAVAIVGANALALPLAQRLVSDVRFTGVGGPGLTALPASPVREWQALAGPSFTVNAGPGQKIYYAAPQRLGLVSFAFGGTVGGFLPPVVISVTDAVTGITEPYYQWESQIAGLGLTKVTILS